MEGTSYNVDPAVEFAASISSQALRGADRVAAFLRELRIAPANRAAGSAPLALPKEFLLGIDLALRFWDWEQSHIFLDVQAGLPGAEELLLRVLSLQRGDELKALVADLAVKSLKLLLKSFVWTAEAEEQISLAIIGDEDDAFIDAIAHFLWTNRHTLQADEH